MLHMSLKEQLNIVSIFFLVGDKEPEALKCYVCWVVIHGNQTEEILALEFPYLPSDFSFSNKCPFS